MIIPLDFQELLPENFYLLERATGDIVPAQMEDVQRLVQYGDGLFESIRCERGKSPFLEAHFQRLKASTRRFYFDVSEEHWSLWALQLNRVIRQWSKPRRLKIILTRKGPGLYTPTDKQGILLLRFDPLKPLEEVHPGVDLSMDKSMFSRHAFGNHKTCSAMSYVQAGIRSELQGREQIVLHHLEAGVIEAQSSNIFFRIGNKLRTPYLDSGCLNGVMRNIILKWSAEEKLDIEERKVRPPELDEAEEIFLSNAVHGPIPVRKFENSRMKSQELCQLLRKKFYRAFSGASS